MDKDITLMFLTVNKVPESWASFHKEKLLEAADGAPIITVSTEPMDWGTNISQKGYPVTAHNIYMQMLRAAKIAKTKYVAVAEDDSLYTKEHFHSFRPKDDEFAYNMSRWALHTWGNPVYSWKNRVVNVTLIAPRELLIQALQEREDKYLNGTTNGYGGEVGRPNVEKTLKLPHYKLVQFNTVDPIVDFNHVNSIDPLEQSKRKAPAKLQALSIPYWGEAKELVKNFK